MKNRSFTIVFSTREDNPYFISHLKKTCVLESVEILQFINKSEFSLTELYNKGLREAHNDIIVFAHDDIIFDEKDSWGSKILRHFEESDFGIIGKAGTTSLTKSGRWWDEYHLMLGQVWHQQADPTTGKVNIWENRYSGNFGDRTIETIIVDGLFFAVHRRRIKKVFDEDFKGFHFYDIDFTFANHVAGVKVGVIFDFKITHKSIGITNEQWEANRIKFIEKWNQALPYSINPVPAYDNLNILIDGQPKVAVVIITKNKIDFLIRCIDSLFNKTTYTNFKIYVGDIDYSIGKAETINKHFITKDNILIYDYHNSNSVKTINNIVRNHIDKDTDLLLFCNENIELLNDALSGCVQIYMVKNHLIGTIGIRLLQTDGRIQNAGIILYIDKQNNLRIAHAGYGSYYSYSPEPQYNVTGTSGSFMMVSKELYSLLGGFAGYYGEDFYDIEFSLRAIGYGKTNCLVGDAAAFYHSTNEEQPVPAGTEQINNDFQKLINFIHNNFNNQRIMQHIHFL